MTSPAGPSTPPPPSGPGRTDIVQLDPDSDKGREVAERFGNILAEIELEIAHRKRADRVAGRAA